MTTDDLIKESRELFDAQKYTEAIQKLNKAWHSISDKTKNIQQQNDVQHWLGRCYLEQALQTKDAALFNQAREHFQKELVLAEQLDGDNGIQEQVYAQAWLGHCYLEQALKTKDAALFDQAREHFQKQLALTEQLDGGNNVQEQVSAQHWLGRCYLEQALQTKEITLFGQAREHFQKQLALAEQLDGDNGIQRQVYAQYWLGFCYLEQALKTKDAALFDQAREHFQKRLTLAERLDGNNSIQEQVYAQFFLGHCYLEQALQTKDTTLFDQAREHFQKELELAEQLDGNNGIQEQVDAQFWLGHCYLEQALQTKDTTLFDQAREHFQKELELAEQLDGNNGIQEQVDAQYWLGHCYLKQTKLETSPDKEKIAQSKNHFDQALQLLGKIESSVLNRELEPVIKRRLRELDFIAGKYADYFNSKQQYIQEQLPSYLDDLLKKNLAAVLAVLSISPIEFDKPLAHYTSPTVCEKLLGIGQKQENQAKIAVSKMRMNSSTYMNDPYEGQSLSDFLGIHEAALENLTEYSPHNAFFTCFSAHVNDLNQFRLYGKVGNTEASGCCLVFNKNGDWIQEPDIAASYRRLSLPNGLADNAIEETAEIQMPSENLPLYQIAYIFYREEYTQHDEYDVMVSDKNFGIRLKPISDNKQWHNIRAKQLQTALNHLRQYFQDAVQNKEKSQENKAALEYIRYLFKDYAFRDEEEFRLLQIEKLDSEKVQYCSATNSVYLEYGDICHKLDEVILGTNYERTDKGLKVEVFRHLLQKKLPRIKVSHSSLPIHASGK